MQAAEPDFQRLDGAVHRALSVGWPQWETPGTGGDLPRKKGLVDFDYTNFKECARVDFYRGTVKDDKPNVVWKWLYHKLPSYDQYWREKQLHCPEATNTVGNAMEALIGVSHAVASAGTRLPHATRLHYDSDDQTRAWADLWWTFQAFGFTPPLRRPPADAVAHADNVAPISAPPAPGPPPPARAEDAAAGAGSRAASPEGSETPLADFGSDHGSDTEPGTSPEPQRRGQRSQGALPATPEALSAPKPAAPLPAPPRAPQTLQAPSVQVLAAELEAGEQREQIRDTTKFRKRKKQSSKKRTSLTISEKKLRKNT